VDSNVHAFSFWETASSNGREHGLIARPSLKRRGQYLLFMRLVTSHVGKYQLIHQLTGGIIEDHLAKGVGPQSFDKTLVLELLRPDMAEDAAFVEMFLDEAMIASRLTHPHIAQVFDFGEADGTYFLAREHIEGPSLSRVIRHAALQQMTLSATLCARIVSQVCEGLAFAHDFTDPKTDQPLRLLHGCIRPHNILLSLQGTAKVVDFGTEKLRSRWTPRSCYAHIPTMGEFAYSSFEELNSQGGLDRRADVYSLGVVLYELLTTRRPFESRSVWDLAQVILSEPMVPAEQHRPELPGALRSILARALAKDRDERYPDCHAFQADLERFILSVGEPVTPQQVAQLIQQVTAIDEPPAVVAAPSTTSGAPLSGDLPTHTPSLRSEATKPALPPNGLEPQACPRWGRGRLLAAAVGLGVLIGGGVLLWKMSAPPEQAPGGRRGSAVRAKPP
jgi:eukaryotic-like serine/threonine-protein kinase